MSGEMTEADESGQTEQRKAEKSPKHRMLRLAGMSASIASDFRSEADLQMVVQGLFAGQIQFRPVLTACYVVVHNAYPLAMRAQFGQTQHKTTSLGNVLK